MKRSDEHARGLLEKARGDAYMLGRGATDPKAPAWALGFHAQQAVEKAVKAVLTAHGKEYPRTHNRSVLLDLLRDAGAPLPPDAAELPRLTPFGAALRYDEQPEADLAQALDRTWASEVVARTITWAESVVGGA
jgi:HEPN domain-containing protein